MQLRGVCLRANQMRAHLAVCAVRSCISSKETFAHRLFRSACKCAPAGFFVRLHFQECSRFFPRMLAL